jgi:hypothetical protein
MFGSNIKPKIDIEKAGPYDFKPLTDGPGPGTYELPVPDIKGGYIEPEQPRLFTMNDMK